MIDLARLLPAALPPGFFIAKSDRDRLRPGAVTLVECRSLRGWRDHEQLRDDLASALVKLQRDNAATLTPDPIYSAVNHSHPTIAQRIARLAVPQQAG